MLEVARPPASIATTGPAASRLVVIRESNRPAAIGRRAGHGDVAAQADQYPGSRRSGGDHRRAVGGECLRRRAQIEAQAAWKQHGPGCPVEGHGPPARRRVRLDRRTVLGDLVQVAVVADLLECPADGRVYRAAGESSRLKGHFDRFEQELARPPGQTRRGVEANELGVVAEA